MAKFKCVATNAVQHPDVCGFRFRIDSSRGDVMILVTKGNT